VRLCEVSGASACGAFRDWLPGFSERRCERALTQRDAADSLPPVRRMDASAKGVDALVSRIAGLHSYEVPCIAVWPIDKLLLSYADWVEESLG
jgi:hypothetical protein